MLCLLKNFVINYHLRFKTTNEHYDELNGVRGTIRKCPLDIFLTRGSIQCYAR